MTVSTLLVLTAVVAGFAAIAALLVRAQPQVRELSTAPVEAPYRKRRPF